MPFPMLLLALCCILVSTWPPSPAPEETSGVSIRLLERAGFSRVKVVGTSDAVWIATNQGAYRIKGEEVRAFLENPAEPISDVIEAGGYVWLMGDAIHRVRGDEVQQMTDSLDAGNTHVRLIEGTIWFATPKGVFILEGDAARQVLATKGPWGGHEGGISFADVKECGNNIWFLTSDGAYILVQGQAKNVLSERILNFAMIAGELWIATEHGFYVAGPQDKSVRKVFNQPGHNVIDVAGTPVLLGPGIPNLGSGVLYVDAEDGCDVQKVGEKIWVLKKDVNWDTLISTPTGIQDLKLGKDARIEGIASINDELWVATNKGAYVLRNGVPKPVLDQDQVDGIWKIGAEIWMHGNKGLYRYQSDRIQLVASEKKGINWRLQCNPPVYWANGKAWYLSETAVYRFDSDVQISVSLKTSDEAWKRLAEAVLPNPFRISGTVTPIIRYERSGRDPYQVSPDRQFQFILDEGNAFARRLHNQEFDSTPKPQQLSSGRHDINFVVRDSWGNERTGHTEIWALPADRAVAVAASTLWIALLLMILIAAPYSRYCNDLLMNPWLRKYGSFGVIPLTLTTVPRLRRHVMQRYFEGLTQDQALKENCSTYIVPSKEFQPEQFASRLHEGSRILVLGQSGIGKTAFLKFVAHHLAVELRHRQSGVLWPVYIPLGLYGSDDLPKMLFAQLSRYGRMTDEALSNHLLKMGGFAFFLDGANEISEERLVAILHSTEAFSNANCLCFSSQFESFILSDFRVCSVPTLGRKEVNLIITERLGLDSGMRALARFTDQVYALCAIPQNLDFMIRLLAREQPLPETQAQLYRVFLSQVVADFGGSSPEEMVSRLGKLSFDRINNLDMVLESDEDPVLPRQIRDLLLKHKLLVRDGERSLFVHELVRAFLAAQYVVQEWEELLDDPELHPSRRWGTLLRFVVAEMDVSTARKFLFRLLQRNSSVAGDLFSWAQGNRPDLCCDWADEFRRAYGEAVLTPGKTM